MSNIYWVGVRQSDIEDTGDLFKGSITIFGDNLNGNIAFCTTKNRINHNLDNVECDLFFDRTLHSLCIENPDIRFMFYNPIKAYQYGELIRSKTLCMNDYELIELLSNKKQSRFLLKDIAKIIPFVTITGNQCTYDNMRNFFVGQDKFVIQKAVSSGGEGTFYITSTTNLDFVQAGEEYIVSPYIDNAISLNAHIMISQSNIVSFPPSVQIIQETNGKLLYCGADYICYKTLSHGIKDKVAEQLKQIGDFVQRRGYRGVIGVDFILKDQQVYFVEFNTRFQASSQLLNKALFVNGEMSLQEFNLYAFNCNAIRLPECIEVNYSNYTYNTGNITIDRLKYVVKSPEVLRVQEDGYSPENPYPSQPDVYLIRVVFGRNICAIQNNRVTLHPNIYCEDIKNILSQRHPHYQENTKIALLNHGAIISDTAIQLAKKHGKIKEAVFDAIDAIIFDSVYVNIPSSCKFSSLSPFCIDVVDNKFILAFNGNILSEIKIDFVPDVLLNKFTHLGTPFDAIINLATDRIRINPAPVCYYKRHGKPCKFCNLPNQNSAYNITEIREVIEYCLENVDFRHFLIGGGTYDTDISGWNIISEIAMYIREKSDKDIYLMSIPPEENSILSHLKKCGITEVAFNLEIFDRKMAKEYMPGKGNIDTGRYMSALSYAVSLWGNTGCVRSLLIYGFDSDEVFLNGIESLCAMGVEPIVSVFRPLEGTDFSELNPPPTLEIVSIFEKCQRITSKYSLILGPDCAKCQNNTLSFSRISSSQ